MNSSQGLLLAKMPNCKASSQTTYLNRTIIGTRSGNIEGEPLDRVSPML
ncbi:hypothetical protein [Chamaesiphon minutus]|nr:hypothetical protein [Chamaesiphon minutus]